MIETRIYLRALEIDDYTTTARWHNDDEIWSSVVGPKYYVGNEYEKKWVEETIFSKDALKLAVCLREDCRHIGIVSLTAIDWINRSAQSNWMIGEKGLWGKGYATEAVLQLLDFGFQERGLHRISCSLLEGNTASRRVAEKCGYRQEGLLRDAVFKNGRFQNLVVMSILRDEYAEVRQRHGL